MYALKTPRKWDKNIQQAVFFLAGKVSAIYEYEKEAKAVNKDTRRTDHPRGFTTAIEMRKVTRRERLR